jgi:hypothetical protein
MNDINKQFETINEILDRIDVKQKEINEKLDELIAALHEYDDENIYKGYDEPNDALKEAAAQYNEELNKEYGESSFEAFKFTNEYLLSLGVEEAERRMDIIGQNGNEGLHYTDVDENEFDDYGERKVVVKDKDKSNNPAKHTGVDKKRNNELPDFKHTPPPPPKPKRRYYKPKNNK